MDWDDISGITPVGTKLLCQKLPRNRYALNGKILWFWGYKVNCSHFFLRRTCPMKFRCVKVGCIALRLKKESSKTSIGARRTSLWKLQALQGFRSIMYWNIAHRMVNILVESGSWRDQNLKIHVSKVKITKFWTMAPNPSKFYWTTPSDKKMRAVYFIPSKSKDLGVWAYLFRGNFWQWARILKTTIFDNIL